MRQKDVWYGKMVTSCGIKRTSHCALLLRARAEHMNTTMHNPYGIAGVRSSIEYSKVFRLFKTIPSCAWVLWIKSYVVKSRNKSAQPGNMWPSKNSTRRLVPGY